MSSYFNLFKKITDAPIEIDGKTTSETIEWAKFNEKLIERMSTKNVEYDYEDEPSSPHIIYVNTDRLQKIDIDDVFASFDIPYNLNFEPTYWGDKWCVIYNDDWSLLFEKQKSGNVKIYYVFGPEKDPNRVVRMGHSLNIEMEGIETCLFNKELMYKIFEEKSVPDLIEDSYRIENKWEYEAKESLDNQEKEIYKAISEVEAKADMEDVIGIYDMCDTYSDMSKEVYGHRDRGIFARARSKFGPNLRNAEREFDALPEAEQDRIRMAFYDKLK